MEDQRFQSLVKDPKCRDIPKNVRKVKVDKRFQKMLKHKNFKGNSRIDERGRIVNFSTTEKLKKLYNLKDSSEEDSSSENSEAEQEGIKEKKSSPLKIKKNEKTKKAKSVDVLEDEEKNLQDGKKSKHLQKDETNAPELVSDLSENIKSSDGDTGSSEDEEESIDLEDELKNLKDDSVAVQKNKEKLPKQKTKTGDLKSKKSDDLQDEKLSGSEEDISDSDDSDSETDIFAERDEFDHNWEEWHEQAPDTDQIFKRLAVCNMDWDRIRADDLFTVFNSFKPASGTINSVKIYPSEFGLKRMETERLNGPPELVEETLEPEAEEKLDKKRAKFHREKLREYQLKRLQYYYAVVDCDSPETADHLYVELNGKEFESSSVRFDLRFVPDDTTFDHEPVSEAYKVPDPSEYRPRYFVSTALGQAKVDLTWDETDPQRQEVLERAFKEPDNIEKDIQDYLASSSGESEEEQIDDPEDKKMKLNDRISKYKELLQSLEEKGKEEEEKYDMEISWQPDLKEKTEKLVKQKLEKPKNPFDEMIKKKKEERKLKKQKKSAANKDEEVSNSESDEEYFDASTDEKPVEKENKKLDELYLISDSKKALDQTKEKSKEKKKKKKQQKNEPEKTQDFKFVEDQRFSAIYTSPEFNLDPSDPHFKKTEGSLAIIQEKQRRLKTKEPPTGDNRKSKKAKYW
ncbi:unnamed protein product [Larinioides sclopetarius]|uniref:ESF1-like protein n=1 Tax=Larinioides sclopetarius TaxID=280406 RepID=A0AAV1ZVN7_9ARAC